MSIRYIDVKVKPMPECQFCGYPLIKEYYEVEGLCFCKKLCIQEFFLHESEGERLNDIVVREE